MANKKVTSNLPSAEAITKAKEGAKTLVVVKGESIRKGYRIKVYGGIIEGVQVLDFPTKQEGMTWLMGWAYGFYMNQGKRVLPQIN